MSASMSVRALAAPGARCAAKPQGPAPAGVPKAAPAGARRFASFPQTTERNARLIANLMMPGGGGPSQGLPGGQRIIDPTKQMQNNQSSRLIVDPNTNAPTGNSYFQPFRAPEEVTMDMTADEMLENLTNRMGMWHDLAPLIPQLTRTGFTAPMIDEICGLTPVEQNCWVVAANVRTSLIETDRFKGDIDFFDTEEETLYAIRTLNGPTRADAANYIVDNRLGSKEAIELSRVLKNHERKRGDKVGFSYQPGDAVAYNLWRLAGESKDPVTIRQVIAEGVESCVTDEAREALEKRLRELLGEEAEQEPVASVVVPKVQTVRLVEDEGSWRPLAVAGKLGEASITSVVEAPASTSTGAFQVFTPGSSGHSWTALPNFVVYQAAKDPTAVLCDDASLVDALKEGANAGEPCVIVIDRGYTEVVADDYYFACGAVSAAAEVVRGADVGELQVAGKVILVVRPALAGATDGSDWGEEEDVDRQAAAAGWL